MLESKFKFIGILLVTVVSFLTSGCREETTLPFQLREDTGIDFRNELLEGDSFNIIQYLYYYNGGGVAAGDINNDGLPDLFFTANEKSNRLYLNQGDFVFKDITESAGIGSAGAWSTGVTMADVNGDGLLDIYVCQLGNYKGKKGRNRLYINQGDFADGSVTFREEAAAYGLDFQGFATQSAFFDYDLDGDLDVYLLNHSVHAVGNYGKAASLRPQRDSLAGDRLLRNEEGHFVDVSESAGIFSSRIGYGLGLAVGDLNNDGWSDLYVSNDFHENDYLYYNNGDGTFTEGIEQSISCTSQFSMGNTIADWNNDNLPDIISLDMKPEEEVLVKNTVGADPYNIYLLKRRFGYYHQFPRNMLQLNRGNTAGQQPVFSEIAQLAGMDATDWSWSPLVVDLDNNGWKDIFITNGIRRRPNDLDYLRYSSSEQLSELASDLELAAKMPSGEAKNYAFRNRGDLTFENVSADWGLDLYGVSNGAAYADLDNDGDNDLVINNLNAPATVYENRIPTGNNYLKIALEGKSPNSFGIGAKVKIRVGDLVQSQELYTTRGYLSAVEPLLLFGVGNADMVDRVTVEWPGGLQTILEQVSANQLLKIVQPEEPAVLIPPAGESREQQENYGLSFQHQENDFIDLEYEPLIPNLLSTQGPRMALADVNGDELEDLYVCGARGQSGALFYQESSGKFQPAPDFFADNLENEEVDAVFFDADQDGDQDLYLVNGGGEPNDGLSSSMDQLYINDGRGHFSYDPQALPSVFSNGSCAVALDFNEDGAMDLFIGARSVPGKYGLDPRSSLLQNDGNGKFLEVTEQHLPNNGKLGMVTDAALLQRSGQPVLVVVGEWMPVQLLSIKAGVWTVESLPGSRGWWNRIALADLNGDGTEDFILGNWGLNSNLKATPEQPLGLYIKDFDGNRNTDPILTYFRQGREFSLASIDELTKQMPSFRKLLDSYTNFSKLTFPEVFKPVVLQGAIEKKVDCLASSIALSKEGGRYELVALPQMAQLSPVFGIVVDDVDQDGNKDILLAGNFYGSRPELGLSDASTGTVLMGDGKGAFQPLAASDSGWKVRGEIRDLKVINLPDKKLFVAARNNQSLIVRAATKTGGKNIFY